MAEISIVHWTYHADKKGESALKLCVCKFGKRKYYDLFQVHPDHWDGKEVTGGNEKKDKNKKIRSKLAELEDLASELERKNKNVSSSEIIKAFKGDRSGSFFKYAGDFIKRYDNERQQYTFNKFEMILDALEAFSGDITFDELSYDLLNKWRVHLAKDGNIDSTIKGKFAKLATIYNDAWKSGKADRNKYPFHHFKFKKSKTKKESLDKNEINLLRNADLMTANERLAIDVFLFCFNFLGMRIGDAVRMKESSRKGNRLKYSSNKSADSFFIDFTDESKRIWDKYAQGKDPDDYLFPLMSKYKKRDQPLHKRIDSATALVNNNLKKIAKRIDLNKHLTSHVNRHSWNMIAKKAGVSREVRKEALGHENDHTIDNYDKALDDSVINDANRIVTGL